jgi:DNA repair protein RAD57
VRYQLPEAARRCGAGLVVVDSVAAHFRAEMLDERERGGSGGGSGGGGGGAAAAMAERRARLVGLGALLRRLARDAGAAVVVSNQVADRIGGFEPSSSMPASAPATAPAAIGGHHPQQQDPLALDHQQRWFTGWGDSAPPPGTGEKTPTLGLAWANQIAGRVALVCESPDEAAPGGFRRRWMRVVFAKWAAQTGGRGVEFRITSDGVEGVDAESGEAT